MSDSEETEGWPCHLSPEVERLLLDPKTDPQMFSAIIATTVVINETSGEVPGHTASQQWPQQRRIPLGPHGSLGVAEYLVVADADPPHPVSSQGAPAFRPGVNASPCGAGQG